MAYDLIGALPAGTKPVWLRAVVSREGSDIVTRCCVVAEGQVLPIEVRVNVPALAASLRAMGLLPPPGQDGVAGFGSFLKKAVKTVTKSKIVKAVGKAVKKVANSPIAMAINPAAIITAHTTTKAVTGKNLVKGKLGKVINLGASVATAAAGPAAKAPSALSFVTPKAAAALGIGLRTVQAAKAAGGIAAVAKQAQSSLSKAKGAAALLTTAKSQAEQALKQLKGHETRLELMKRAKLPAAQIAKAQADVSRLKTTAAAAQKKLSTTKDYALPIAKQSVKLKATLPKVAPALAKKVVISKKVQDSVKKIAEKARAGSADAQQAAAVIAKSAQALDKILQLQAQAAGGIPGLLVTADGRVMKAPRGRFQLRTTTAARPDILYRGAKEPQLKGLFAAVSGASAWGGDRDPGNEIDGPLLPVRYSESWELDDYSTVGAGRPVIDTSGVGALTP